MSKTNEALNLCQERVSRFKMAQNFIFRNGLRVREKTFRSKK